MHVHDVVKGEYVKCTYTYLVQYLVHVTLVINHNRSPENLGKLFVERIDHDLSYRSWY